MTCGLRDYGTATWEGGKDGCDHAKPDRQGENGERANRTTGHDDIYKDVCKKCGAKRIDNQLGLEKTPEEYIENTVTWAREVWRVLRDDGCFFLNLGDSYAASGPTGGAGKQHTNKGSNGVSNRKAPDGLKPKDLCMIPARVALALQADGWYLRSAMPWVKRSCMPESCTDRPASALEYMFLLTKSSKYYFDMDAIRKEHKPSSIERIKHGWNGKSIIDEDGKERRAQPDPTDQMGDRWATPAGRNFRNTDLFYQSLEEPHGAIFAGEEMVGLDVNPQAYSEAHFATFPEKIVEPCIKAGTSEKGACPECGAPWERVVEKNEALAESRRGNENYQSGGLESGCKFTSATPGYTTQSKTIGWQPTCKCGHKETVPCVVLDNFGGSGTTKNVADRLGRRGVILELKMEYIEMAKKRCYQDPSLFA